MGTLLCHATTVQHHDRRILEQCACNGDPLPLAAREPRPILAEPRLSTLWQAPYEELLTVSSTGRCSHLLIRSAQTAHADVLRDRVVKERHVLEDLLPKR